jgi:outer membrane protein assembly factor BamD
MPRLAHLISRTPHRRFAFRAWLCGFSLIAACANGPDLSADYGATARENYELAVAEFADRDWEEAVSYADFVRIRFPFSRYSVESELLISRAQFAQGNYITAQDGFKQFAKLHPTHEHVRNGWVAYMAASSAYMAAPESFFLLPPHYQRDQSLMRGAKVELLHFLDHYPASPLRGEAENLLDEVNRKLLEHELYVARFYLDRDRPRAAVSRLESAHARYPNIGMDADVLFLLGVTYLRLGEIELSRETFSELQSQHPEHHKGEQAKLYLAHILEEYGPADPQRVRPPNNPPVPMTPSRPKRDYSQPAWRTKKKTPPKAPEPEGKGASSTPTAK